MRPELWSVRTIASGVGVKERAIQRALLTLAAEGWITVTRRKRDNGSYQSSRYTLRIPPGVTSDTTPGATTDTSLPSPATPLEQTTEQTTYGQTTDSRARASAGTDAPAVPQHRYAFADEDMDLARNIVTMQAREHLHVICGRQEANYLIRTLLRSGQRTMKDLTAYAAASFRRDPERWRGLLIACSDNNGHAPDFEDTDLWDPEPLAAGLINFTSGEWLPGAVPAEIPAITISADPVPRPDPATALRTATREPGLEQRTHKPRPRRRIRHTPAMRAVPDQQIHALAIRITRHDVPPRTTSG